MGDTLPPDQRRPCRHLRNWAQGWDAGRASLELAAMLPFRFDWIYRNPFKPKTWLA